MKTKLNSSHQQNVRSASYLRMKDSLFYISEKGSKS